VLCCGSIVKTLSKFIEPTGSSVAASISRDASPIPNQLANRKEGSRLRNAGPSFLASVLQLRSEKNGVEMLSWDVWAAFAIASAGTVLAGAFDPSLSAIVLISLALCAYLAIRNSAMT
jgi:hypothetical protein